MVLRRLSALLRVLPAVVTTAGLMACAETALLSGPSSRTVSERSAQPRPYRFGIGDKLKITVYGEQDLSGQFEVNALGMVPMPLIGEMAAKGLSLAEFREAVQRKLSEGYLKSPKVNVEIISYRPIFVHGEVRNGGEYAFKNGTRVRDVIAMAGGYTYRADQGEVLISREGEPAEMRVRLPSDLIVVPGDNIRVPERFF